MCIRDRLEAGLWTRFHAYHEGHSTVLTKLGLLADNPVIDFVLEKFRTLLRRAERQTRRTKKGKK